MKNQSLVSKGLSGVVSVLNTPFRDDNILDCDALINHVGYAVKTGVNGFLVPAMASEVDFLSRNERRLMVGSVVDACRGKVPVIGGASAGPEERRSVVLELIELGCDGILISIPYFDEESYRRDVEDIAGTGVEYLMLQDWDAAGNGIPVEVISRLVGDIPALKCLKIETVPAGPKYSAIKKATNNRIQVAGGWAVMHLIDGFDRGVDIVMPTAMHELYVGIHTLYHLGRREEAVNWFRRLLPILTFSNQHLEISIHFFKRMLYRQGIYPTDQVRTSARFWDEFNRRRADELIDEALLLMEKISSEI